MTSEDKKAECLLEAYNVINKWDAQMNADYLTEEAFEDLKKLVEDADAG
jgi:hypothetical protein